MRHAAFVIVTQVLHAGRAADPIIADVVDWLRVAEAAATQLNPLAKGAPHLWGVFEKEIDKKMIGWHYYEWR